jgi:hypothetical protein
MLLKLQRELGATTSNNVSDDQTIITTSTICSIFATSAVKMHLVDATTVHTDPDGTYYSIRRLNANRVIRVSPMQTNERIIDGLIDGGSNNVLAGEAMRLWGESVDSQRVDVIGCNCFMTSFHTRLLSTRSHPILFCSSNCHLVSILFVLSIADSMICSNKSL